MRSIFKQYIEKYRKYKEHKYAFNIGKRAGAGHNIYLTFGSEKTITKDAKDSYARYEKAMKHYNQKVCQEDGFLIGYNSTNVSSVTKV